MTNTTLTTCVRRADRALGWGLVGLALVALAWAELRRWRVYPVRWR
jgi:hypothetical protein